MKANKIFMASAATLVLGIFAGCQTVQPPDQTETKPVGQSTSTVQITNTSHLVGGATQEKMFKPFDGSVPAADQQAFTKAQETKNPQFCNSITVQPYQEFCVKMATDATAAPLRAPTQEEIKCKTTTDANGVKNCINFEQ